MTLGEKINQANAEALKRILGAQPTLVGWALPVRTSPV